MSNLPDWVINLVAEVENYEDVHSAVSTGEHCLGGALHEVPGDVRAEARGWRRAQRAAGKDVDNRNHDTEGE